MIHIQKALMSLDRLNLHSLTEPKANLGKEICSRLLIFDWDIILLKIQV